jgi:hypothetical protein
VRLTRIAGLIAAGALTLAVAAPVGAADNAMVRVLHGSPDAPAVDVYANGGKIISNLAFGSISDYLAVPGGDYNIRVCVAGSDGTVDANCPIIATLTFDAGKKYTVTASDLVAQIKANVFVDGNPVDGKASVRVIHLSADTPAVDVATQDGSAKVVENLSYPDATGYLQLDPGNYDLKVCVAGSDATNDANCPLDLPALDLAGGTAYTVFAIGSLNGGDGVQGLTAKVGVDGVAAPATDTVPAGNGSVTPMLFLAAAAAFGLAITLRFAPAIRRTK